MKKVLITGANGGIGLALVKLLLAENKYQILAHYHRNCSELEAFKNLNIEIIQGSFSTKEGIENFTKQLQKYSIDILINNAGSYTFRTSFEAMTFESISSLLNTNTITPALLVKSVLPSMKINKWGRIINISSIGVKHGGGAGTADYTFSKSALEMMTKTLAKEYSKYNILINTVRVGVTDTKIHDLNPNKDLNKRASMIPIKRIADPNEIAKTILFLCSEFSSYISGSTITVAGGE